MDAFDLGATATPLPDFTWSAECLSAYEERFGDDGNEGRLVGISPQAATWDSWERHPAGEELVVLLSGRVDVIQELKDGTHVIELHPGEALINPPHV